MNKVTDYLSANLDPELQERYRKRRADAIAQQEANFQSPNKIDELYDRGQDANLYAGLSVAANKFGSIGGDGGPTSAVPQIADRFMKTETDDYNRRQGLYNQGQRNEDAAYVALNNIEDRAKETDAYEKSITLKDEEQDPNSDISKTYQMLAKKMMPDGKFDGASAFKLKSAIPSISNLYEIDEKRKSNLESSEALSGYRNQTREDKLRESNLNERYRRDALSQQERLRRDSINMQTENRNLLQQERNENKQQKLEEKNEALRVGDLGYANTPDDAKKLKEAVELKASFDEKLQEMIDLRKKHSGGALFNRTDVARGNQLSKDLLLQYKDMAKLGVLSKSDEQILNAIIPEDPLEYNSPLAAVQGQDPTLNRLERFKSDNEKDYQSKLNVRLKRGSPGLKDKVTPSVSVPVDADKQAKDWADKNPNDPRAKNILERLKLKGKL